MIFDSRQYQLKVPPRIDHRRLAALVVPNKGAVLLERGDRNGFVLQHAANYQACGEGKWITPRGRCRGVQSGSASASLFLAFALQRLFVCTPHHPAT
jgi:hypothetical protein